MIEFQCPKCGKQYRVKDEGAGKRGKCTQCGEVLKVPSLRTGAPDVAGDTPIPPAPQSVPSPQPIAPPMAAQTPRLESGHAAQATSINVHLPKRRSSLGVVSLILGIVGFLICWIPFVGVLSIPLSALGLLMAVIGLLVALLRRGSGIGWPIGGGAVSGLALAIGMAQVAAIGAGAEAISEYGEQAMRTNQATVNSGSGRAPAGSQGLRDDGVGEGLAAGGISGAADARTPEWASARGAVRQGAMEVHVTNVVLGKVPLRGGFEDRESTSQDELLAIHVEMTNRSQNRKLQYRSWAGRDVSFARDYATLRDNFGNSYKRIGFGFDTKPIGHTQSESVYPGKMLTDVLVFEPPIDTAEYLDLELPAANFGGDGMLRLRIPSDMVQRR
jgi:predicted Zn finger-like uncharacterized protein